LPARAPVSLPFASSFIGLASDAYPSLFDIDKPLSFEPALNRDDLLVDHQEESDQESPAFSHTKDESCPHNGSFRDTESQEPLTHQLNSSDSLKRSSSEEKIDTQIPEVVLSKRRSKPVVVPTYEVDTEEDYNDLEPRPKRRKLTKSKDSKGKLSRLD
jgi:hypothetical protein